MSQSEYLPASVVPVWGQFSDGLVIDAQLGQLIQAMASYPANGSGFGATPFLHAPAESNPPPTIATGWH